MLLELILTLGIGTVSYYLGQNSGEQLSIEEANERVIKDKQAYADLIIPEIWLKNTIASGFFTFPAIGIPLGALALFEKGMTSGAYVVVGEQKPILPVSPLIEILALALSGAQGIKNTYNLIKREPIDLEQTIEILGISSTGLAVAAIIEYSELK